MLLFFSVSVSVLPSAKSHKHLENKRTDKKTDFDLFLTVSGAWDIIEAFFGVGFLLGLSTYFYVWLLRYTLVLLLMGLPLGRLDVLLDWVAIEH